MGFGSGMVGGWRVRWIRWTRTHRLCSQRCMGLPGMSTAVRQTTSEGAGGGGRNDAAQAPFLLHATRHIASDASSSRSTLACWLGRCEPPITHRQQAVKTADAGRLRRCRRRDRPSERWTGMAKARSLPGRRMSVSLRPPTVSARKAASDPPASGGLALTSPRPLPRRVESGVSHSCAAWLEALLLLPTLAMRAGCMGVSGERR